MTMNSLVRLFGRTASRTCHGLLRAWRHHGERCQGIQGMMRCRAMHSEKEQDLKERKEKENRDPGMRKEREHGGEEKGQLQQPVSWQPSGNGAHAFFQSAFWFSILFHAVYQVTDGGQMVVHRSFYVVRFHLSQSARG